MEITQTNSLGRVRIDEVSITLRSPENFSMIDSTDQTTGTITSEWSRDMNDSKSSVADIYWRNPSR